MKTTFGIVCAAICAGLIVSCKTDDVKSLQPSTSGPSVSLSADPLTISENNGQATITATLDASSTSVVTVNLGVGGTASGAGIDYTLSSQSIEVQPGNLTGTITLSAVQDTLQEGTESVELSIASVTGGTAGTNNQVTVSIEDDDVAFVPNIIVNEILYDPSNNGLDGDANGDGVYDQEQDSFVEFVNMSAQPVDMSGYQIYDTEALTSGTPRDVIPNGTVIQPGKALVVFGGGTPTGSFGGATVQTATTGTLNLNNSGDVMTLMDTNGNVVVSFDDEPYSNNPNESYTRFPDLTGDFVQSSTVSSALFSPGTKVDGTPF